MRPFHFSVPLYALLVTAIVWGMLAARQQILKKFSTAGSVAEWQAWREDVRKTQSNPGPVARRTPRSTEPPALVLMRDHFAVLLFGAILFSSALYWVLAWFTIGMLHSREVIGHTERGK